MNVKSSPLKKEIPFRFSYFLLLVIVWVFSVCFLNNKISPSVLYPVVEFFGNFFDPSEWINGSYKYREKMVSIYYVSALSTIPMMFVGLLMPTKGRYFEMWMPLATWRKVVGLLVLVILLIYFMFLFGFNEPVYESDSINKWSRFLLNSVVGICVLNFFIAHIAYQFGILFKVTVSSIFLINDQKQ